MRSITLYLCASLPENVITSSRLNPFTNTRPNPHPSTYKYRLSTGIPPSSLLQIANFKSRASDVSLRIQILSVLITNHLYTAPKRSKRYSHLRPQIHEIPHRISLSPLAHRARLHRRRSPLVPYPPRDQRRPRCETEDVAWRRVHEGQEHLYQHDEPQRGYWGDAAGAGASGV